MAGTTRLEAEDRAAGGRRLCDSERELAKGAVSRCVRLRTVEPDVVRRR